MPEPPALQAQSVDDRAQMRVVIVEKIGARRVDETCTQDIDTFIVEQVDDWDRNDFDSMYVVAITQLKDGTRATFEHKHEGLDGQPDTCPH
jgi:hypothetical protein